MVFSITVRRVVLTASLLMANLFSAGGDIIKVKVVSSKCALSPARTVTVPAIVPGVSTPSGVIVQPRAGGRMLNGRTAGRP